MISILLVDDEPLAHQRMQGLLATHPEVEIMAVASSLAEARACLALHTPDVVFLDVEMSGGNAFSLLPSVGDSTRVVFVTAHERYAVEAFAMEAVDYLLKPVAPERLAETLRRLAALSGEASAKVTVDVDALPALQDSARSQQPMLWVTLKGGNQKAVVNPADICWIESLRNYSRVALRNPGRLLVFRRRLGEWLDDLPENTFARISRSEVIQLALVTSTEWTSQGETSVFFDEGVPPITLGRISAGRLGKLLEAQGTTAD